MTAFETDGALLMRSYAEAVRARDADAVIALYAPEARVFDAWDAWSHEGAGAWAAVVRGWLGAPGAGTVEVRWHDVRIEGGGELALLTAIVTYAWIGTGGRQERAMQNRLSWVLGRRGGRAVILHEHTSAPIRHADMKPILVRAGDA
jgi:uncharacterized protein (TIGR02246 family)